jgi:hypothetical protein
MFHALIVTTEGDECIANVQIKWYHPKRHTILVDMWCDIMSYLLREDIASTDDHNYMGMVRPRRGIANTFYEATCIALALTNVTFMLMSELVAFWKMCDERNLYCIIEYAVRTFIGASSRPVLKS